MKMISAIKVSRPILLVKIDDPMVDLMIFEYNFDEKEENNEF